MSIAGQGCIYLVRHGETAWSITGQHTGRTDLALTPHGEEEARAPLQRAHRTCELAGFGAAATLDPDLLEWDYGQYEGRTLQDIHQKRPEWELFRDGCPGGESVEQISERADRVVSHLLALKGKVLLFSSGHILRVLAARWVEAPAALGRHLVLDPACLCVLGYDHGGLDRVIRLWNAH